MVEMKLISAKVPDLVPSMPIMLGPISAALEWDKCNKSKMDLYRRIAKGAEKFTIYV